MKSPANKSAPKARVMWADTITRDFSRLVHTKTGFEGIPVLVRPCHSRKQAAQLARVANMKYNEKLAMVAASVTLIDSAEKCARAILSLLGEQPGKGDGRE